ncbi:hypothetical protein AGOR_G00086960 [Albula goreensis]|uniref:Prostaglandin E2 receptor EP2 subtype n=1 Tax=Albula goreensis TaxID=1534307 RepID=A0A8T3DP92_9TELE|nr:hypothetical protein AGOR_G00086960 [Albula goreensis]
MEPNATESIQRLCQTRGKSTIAWLMFLAGLTGNVIALVILQTRRRKDRRHEQKSLFRVLVTTLVITDLVGTCAVSPLVLASYAANKTMLAMGHGPNDTAVCKYFGFSMTFFSLATMSILFAMALERYFSIGYPYLYERHFGRRCGYISVSFIYVLCVLFCVLPFLDIGHYVQYCPGTWCFIQMNTKEFKDIVYANLYATVMLLLISSTAVCNLCVIYNLVRMYRRRKATEGSVVRRKGSHRSHSITEEVEHLLFLVFMTVAFVICSLPLMVRVYMDSLGRKGEDHRIDLIALRFLSINPIINPWVFIILGPSRLQFLRGALCRARKASSHPQKVLFTSPSLASPDTSVSLHTKHWADGQSQDSWKCIIYRVYPKEQ